MCEKKEFKKEYYLHQITQKKLYRLFRLRFVSSEKKYSFSQEEYDYLHLGDIGFDENRSPKEKLSVIPDNIAFDKKTGELVIIEYKNKSDPNVLKQVEKYKRVVRNNLKEFNKREYNVSGNKLEEPVFFQFDKEKYRIMIIAPEFDPTVKKECNDVELWEVSLCDKHNNGKGKVIYKNLKSGYKVKLDIDLGDVELTEKDVVENNVPEEKRKEICDLYRSFRKKVMDEYDEYDVDLIPITNGVAFRVNNQLVCIVYFHKFYGKYDLQIHYKTDELVCPLKETNNCELCPKNRTNKERDCPKDKTNSDLGCLRNIKCKDYVGNYEFILKSEEDVDFAFELFKQAYEEKMEE